MRITIDGISLYEWCKRNNKKYNTIRYRIYTALNVERVRKPKKTYEQILLETRIRNRIRYGYTPEQAALSDEDFNRLRAMRYGAHKIGKFNLKYVCETLGVKYNTVFIQCIKRQRMDPREYLESKGYDLTQFEE